jgi:hypothetical protein
VLENKGYIEGLQNGLLISLLIEVGSESETL